MNRLTFVFAIIWSTLLPPSVVFARQREDLNTPAK